MLHQLNIALHVLAGIIAVGFGIVAYATHKGGAGHRRNGRLFLACLSVVILTAVNGLVNFVDRPFLAVVTLQSAYFGWTGWRAVKRKSQALGRIDLAVALFAAAVIAWFFWGISSANIVWDQRVVWYLLLYVLVILTFDLVRYFWPGLIRSSRFWLYDHLFRMTSAFTALFSAGVGTVMGDWVPWSQIIPAVAGTLWLLFALWYFPRQIA
ncbi:MAG: hypothetical protein AAFN92_08760 [Bacteroidota bacterium]